MTIKEGYNTEVKKQVEYNKRYSITFYFHD